MSGATSTKMTYEDLLRLTDEEGNHGVRELIDGELIVAPSPVPNHQRIVKRLLVAIDRYLEDHPIGEVLVAPLDIVLADEQVLQPDVLYISRERSSRITDRNISGSPDLAIEVLSEFSRRRDEIRKRALYEEYGVIEYWIVDPEAESVKVFQRRQGRFHGSLAGQTLTTPLLPGFSLDLPGLFAAR
jgi:Uma2 family endonuclease